MKIKINIQSISDIITNSSSEVFCTITGKDTKSIYETLSPLFNGDADFAPFLEYWEEGEYDEDTPRNGTIKYSLFMFRSLRIL